MRAVQRSDQQLRIGLCMACRSFGVLCFQLSHSLRKTGAWNSWKSNSIRTLGWPPVPVIPPGTIIVIMAHPMSCQSTQSILIRRRKAISSVGKNEWDFVGAYEAANYIHFEPSRIGVDFRARLVKFGSSLESDCLIQVLVLFTTIKSHVLLFGNSQGHWRREPSGRICMAHWQKAWLVYCSLLRF